MPETHPNHTPSRLKFKFQVGALNMLDKDFVAQVTRLQSEYNRREEMIERLDMALACSDSVRSNFPGHCSQADDDFMVNDYNSFLQAMHSAIERWVVDNK